MVSLKLFGKKSEASGSGDDGASGGGGAFTPDPGKAARFFEHARNMHDSTNYAYAMVLWLKGLKLDPTSMDGLEAFCNSAGRFVEDQPKAKGPTKDQLGQVPNKDAVDKYTHALLQWGARRFDWDHGIKAMEAAAALDLAEQAYWIGTRALSASLNDAKAGKKPLVKLLDLFEKIGAYDKAVLAGDAAVRADPRDAKLEHRVKNLSAQATMTRGGFEEAGTEGGFRKIIKDADAQRQLIEEESVVKSQATLEGLIERYREAVQNAPDDLPTITKYVQFLLERGTTEDERAAFETLMRTHQKTGQYRFKQQAGEIRLRAGRRKLRALRDKAESDPSKREAFEQFAKGLLEEEIKEFTERVEKYPTDLNLKFELGRRLFEAGRYEEAIGHFQLAQNASGIAGSVRNHLGQAFKRLGWLSEAEETFRGAISNHSGETDDLGLTLRYGLMSVLQDKAEQEHDLGAAQEALRIAQKIAMHQINYRDIRDRRSALQGLVKQLQDAA